MRPPDVAGGGRQSAPHKFGPPLSSSSTAASHDGRVGSRSVPDQPWFVIWRRDDETRPLRTKLRRRAATSGRSRSSGLPGSTRGIKLDTGFGSHSGIYFRGPLRNARCSPATSGSQPDKFSHMSVYGVGGAPGEREQAGQRRWRDDGRPIVANKISVTLNGQKVHDNTTLDAITTNAVDPNELEPGPIRLVEHDGKDLSTAESDDYADCRYGPLGEKAAEVSE